MSTLKEKLEAFGNETKEQRAASDAYLAQVWRGFKDTEAHQALHMVLGEIHQVAMTSVCDARTNDGARAFASGVIAAVLNISRVIDSAIQFDPNTADYDQPALELDADEVKAAEAEDEATVY